MTPLWPSIIAGIAAIIAAGLGYRNRQAIVQSRDKLDEIHILVNSRLDEALNTIKSLKIAAKEIANKEDENALRDKASSE